MHSIVLYPNTPAMGGWEDLYDIPRSSTGWALWGTWQSVL